MNDRLIELAGILIAVVLAVDSLLHVYWATGRDLARTRSTYIMPGGPQ